jgi:hypothetical protein
VRWLTAVQSQDYAGAKWALGQRCRGVTEAEIDRLFDEGAILRTHVMRPTWHFVLPQDIRWLLDLTGRRLRLGIDARSRTLELDDKAVARAGVSPQDQRLPHLLARAEVDGLIVSGPRRGKQFTYALLKERVPMAPVIDRTEALAELTGRYFRSHGPAQVQDFAWWSGLTLADARTGIALAGRTLERQAIAGKDYWFGAEAGPAYAAAGVAHLLPNYDEYTVAYRDRAAVLRADRPFEPAFFAFGSILTNVVTVGGRVRGAWRRTFARGSARIEIRVLEQLASREATAVAEAGRRMGHFLERPVELTWL